MRSRIPYNVGLLISHSLVTLCFRVHDLNSTESRSASHSSATKKTSTIFYLDRHRTICTSIFPNIQTSATSSDPLYCQLPVYSSPYLILHNVYFPAIEQHVNVCHSSHTSTSIKIKRNA